MKFVIKQNSVITGESTELQQLCKYQRKPVCYFTKTVSESNYNNLIFKMLLIQLFFLW